MSKNKMITLLNMNVIEVYDHVSKAKLLHNLRKKKNFHINHRLNKQFHAKSTNHFRYKQRHDENE